MDKYLLIFWMCAVFFLGCRESPKPTKSNIYPVKFTMLQTSEPGKLTRLAGAAKAWRQENLAFEVSGRLQTVADENAVVHIFSKVNQDGSFSTVGQVVAELESSRYDADVKIAHASLVAAESEVKVIEIAIEKLIPQDIQGALEKVASLEIVLKQVLPNESNRVESQLNLAKQEFGRAKDLFERNAGTRQLYDQAQNQLDSAISLYNQIKANILAKERELAVANTELAKARASLVSKIIALDLAKAGVDKAQAQLSVALKNQEDCKLRTPFSGVISSRLVTSGAVVGPQRPVVTVTMIDPINIEVAVSQEMARGIQIGDPVEFYPSTLHGKSIRGWVEKKSVSADPSTRTYLISCICRNKQISFNGETVFTPQLSKEDIALVWQDNPDAKNSFMVWTRSILKDSQGYYVWTLKDFILGEKKLESFTVSVTKVRVELGNTFRSFVQKEHREVICTSGLSPAMMTFRGDFANLQEGLKIDYIPVDWMIRPGDLVLVSFDLGSYPKGIYVPISSIFQDKEGQYIFVHDRKRAKKIRVSTHEFFSELRRIKPMLENINLEGMELIVLGGHYIKDGDEVIPSRLGGE